MFYVMDFGRSVPDEFGIIEAFSKKEEADAFKEAHEQEYGHLWINEGTWRWAANYISGQRLAEIGKMAELMFPDLKAQMWKMRDDMVIVDRSLGEHEADQARAAAA